MNIKTQSDITEFAVSFIEDYWEDLINTEFHIIYKRKKFLIWDIRKDYLLACMIIKEVMPTFDTRYKDHIIYSTSQKFVIQINNTIYFYHYPVFIKMKEPESKKFIKDMIWFTHKEKKFIKVLSFGSTLFFIFFLALFLILDIDTKTIIIYFVGIVLFIVILIGLFIHSVVKRNKNYSNK